MSRRGALTRTQASQNAQAKARRDGSGSQSKAERFRERFVGFLAKHNLQGDKDAQTLLRDTERWLSEPDTRGRGDVHLAASFPSLARVIEKITDPTASEAFQGLMREMDELRNSNSTLTMAVTALREEVNGLRTDNSSLQEQVNGLRTDNGALQEQVNGLRADNGTLQEQVNGLRTEIDQFKGTLGVREAMRCLEHWIAIDIVGSKNRVRNEGVFTVKELARSSAYAQTLKQRYGVHLCNVLTFLKKQGDTTAHSAATRDCLEQAIKEFGDTEEEVDVALRLVGLLDDFCRKNQKPFGWDPLASEAENRKRLLQSPTGSGVSETLTGTPILLL